MLVLPKVLTIDQARDAMRLLDSAIGGGGATAVAIDASGLERFDTAAVAVLLECRRRAGALDRGFELHGAPAKLSELINLYGVESLLEGTQPAAK